MLLFANRNISHSRCELSIFITTGVPSDHEGIIPSALEEILTNSSGPNRPKVRCSLCTVFLCLCCACTVTIGASMSAGCRGLYLMKCVQVLYTIPTGQNPSGSTIPPERREQIYHLAQKYDLFILEDDPYWNLYYGEVPLKSFWSMDVDGRVLRLDSFSKVRGKKKSSHQTVLSIRISVLPPYDTCHPFLFSVNCGPDSEFGLPPRIRDRPQVSRGAPSVGPAGTLPHSHTVCVSSRALSPLLFPVCS